ncbi:MAG: TIGR03088 family PEP-CTERM/XrtA system glycosyltransferase [Burkholderiales bacterium]|nr:TIGR03088 family PEP-CTERM/XrtA system glycosyltransferase [Burkholderiales bacterium]
MGGMENGVVNLINSMPADKYRHAIACVEDYTAFRERIRRPDVEVVALHRSRIGVWRLRRELYALFRRLRPAIVHSRNTSGLDALLPAVLAGVEHRVHGEHGWDVGDLRGEAFKPALLRRLHAPMVSRYITVSQDLSRYLQTRVGVSAAKITHICNGVDTQRFAPDDSPRRREVLPAAFVEDDLFLIGTVGRLQAVKDQALLIRAFAVAIAAHPALRRRLRLAVVGDGPLREDLQALVASLGIAELTWMPGAMNDVPAVLRAFDLFVLPSLNEGISNTILEALASGLPVVATNVGGSPELIDDGVTGQLFAPGDREALTGILVRYAENPALCRQQHAAARASALERFDLGGMVRRYQAVYDELTRAP